METTYITTFIVAFVASILSGIAGGGVGFITTPFWLVIGMSPATGGATSAFMATGMSISSLALYRLATIEKDAEASDNSHLVRVWRL